MLVYRMSSNVNFTPPLSELLEDNAIGETLSANTDALQHTVASQLIKNQMRLQFTSLCGTVGIVNIFHKKAKLRNNCMILVRVYFNENPTFFSWLGMMQRTKLGLVFLRVVMRLLNCSL